MRNINQKMKVFHNICLMLLLSYSCQNGTENSMSSKVNQESAPKSQLVKNSSSDTERLIVMHQDYRMREEAGLQGAVIAELRIEEELIFLNESTPSEVSIRLGEKNTTGDWLKVKRGNDQIGWVYGPGTVPEKNYVEITGSNSFKKNWKDLSAEQSALLMEMKTPRRYLVSGTINYVKSLKKSVYKDGPVELSFKQLQTDDAFTLKGQYKLGKAIGTWTLQNKAGKTLELLIQDGQVIGLQSLKKTVTVDFGPENANWPLILQHLS